MPDGSPFVPLISDPNKSANEFDNFTLPKETLDRHGMPLPGATGTAEQLQFKSGDLQWLRQINLTVFGGSDDKGTRLNLSNLRINFRLTKQTNSSPNFLEATIYNLSPKTVKDVKQFNRIELSAGYESNFGMIFDGTVVLYITGKENAVDSYIKIFAGDQDIPIVNDISNLTFDAGVLEDQQVISALKQQGHTIGEVNLGKDGQKTLRSTHYLGSTTRFIRNHMNATDSDFFVDDGKYYAISRSGYRKGEIVKLSPTTGLVGFPKVTPSGIEATCLLNPKLRIGGLVQIETSLLSDIAFIPGSKVGAGVYGPPSPYAASDAPFSSAGPQLFKPTNRAFAYQGASVAPTGIYKILLLNHHGDTRGNPWYSDMVCTATGQVNAPGTAFKRSAIAPRPGTTTTGVPSIDPSHPAPTR